METTNRQIAANLVRELLAGKINFKEFMIKYPDYGKDNDIDELYDLIEHEPKQGGLLGISQIQHDTYLRQINKLIEKLENE